MKAIQSLRALQHLFFPHCCPGCGSDVLDREQVICLPCISRLPTIGFHEHSSNPVDNIFRGRLPLLHATSYLYFAKDSLSQHLIHQFKYKGRKEIAYWFGKRMGEALTASSHFRLPDALVPVPLFAARQRRRGYNQSMVLCEGIAATTGLPIWENTVIRTTRTQTQTSKNRIERWQNIEGGFAVQDPSMIQGRHLLLVDDVVTTGATLEACGQALLAAGNIQLSIATLALATR